MWHPIETAPKDGRTVLLFTPTTRGGRITLGWAKAKTSGTYVWGTTPYINSTTHPTHWQPLPEPPVTP